MAEAMAKAFGLSVEELEIALDLGLLSQYWALV